jgi:predicted transcriptional regulator
MIELAGQHRAETFRALASETRMRILDLLGTRDANIAEIGSALGLAQPTVTRHMQVLEQVGLVVCEYMPGAQGMQKRCRLGADRLMVSLGATRAPSDCVEEVSMPVGLFTCAEPSPTCGLASAERIIGFLDEPQSFLHPDRASARLLWMADGFVEYRFPNTLPSTMRVERLELAAELCSECPDYDNDYPSDITVWINGVEIGSWTSPGDLGGKRGRLNPAWWSDHMTQYGMMKMWSVDSRGSYVDGFSASGTTITDIGIEPHGPIAVRLGVKPDARDAGGLNLFGRGFGNYDQDPTIRLHYVPRNDSPRRNGTTAGTWLAAGAEEGGLRP